MSLGLLTTGKVNQFDVILKVYFVLAGESPPFDEPTFVHQ